MQQHRIRDEEKVSLSPSSKLRAQQAVPEPYRSNRRDGSDRSPVVQQRNMSPLKVDGARRGGDGIEGRDYDWPSSSQRSGHGLSRSPPADFMRKRSQFDYGTSHRSCSPPAPPPLLLRPRYELAQTVDCCVGKEDLDSKRVYSDREKVLIENRLGSGQGMMDHKVVINENDEGGSYGLIPDMGVSVTPHYQETGEHLPRPSRNLPMGRFEHRRMQHRDLQPVDIPSPRVVSYSTVSPSYKKDFAGPSYIREYGSSSVEMPRGDFLYSHDDDCFYLDVSRSSRKLPEHVEFSGHGERPHIHSSRNPGLGHGIGQRGVMYHQREHADYFNCKLHVRTAQDEHVYQYDDLPRRIAPHGRLDYDQSQMESDDRELSRPYISHPDLDRTGKIEDSYGNDRRGVFNDHPPLQKTKYFDYHDTRRTSIAPLQGESYLHSGYNNLENRERMQEEDFHVSRVAQEADRSYILRSEYESRRDRGSRLQQERYYNPPLYRQAVRVQDMKQDLDVHGHSDRPMKRKYNANDEIDVHDFRTIKSSKWDGAEEFRDLYESEEWVDGRDIMLYSSGDIGASRKIHEKRDYSELEDEDFPSDGWIFTQDSQGGHGQRPSFRFQKYSSQNVKHHSKSSASSCYKSQQYSKRTAIHKQPKVWRNDHGFDEIKRTTIDESSEDWISVTESEPVEGSEEFEQMVHEAFLIFSKKLNLNLSVQRRYQNQGKAGSLYCIVCGRSSSKEFMDTRRLVTHVFMSHKVGMRAKHMGLHKAICVMMGWDTVVPQETITWVPQILPPAEALAQKEDLIIWPPVIIIHNISMSDDNPQNWKVVSMETIESLLRGKGFVRGRIKLCLGKPADQSVILVKFLGTFVGLGDAERLHKYLSDNNRGRAEYERVKSEGTTSCNIKESDEGDEVESILCGYVGIAEDLDKLDFNSKNWSLIKSRKDIEDLDNAPVKTNERQ